MANESDFVRVTGDFATVIGGYSLIQDQPDPFAKLPALADRLGVKPHAGGAATLTISTRDGRRYDVFDLMTAMLDRMDAASKS